LLGAQVACGGVEEDGVLGVNRSWSVERQSEEREDSEQ
jgi:hypothetical protein